MILALVAKGKKTIACTMLALMYVEMILPPVVSGAPGTGPLRIEKPVHQTVKTEPATVVIPLAAPAEKAIAKAVTANAIFRGGPTQPESQEFHPVGEDNMVNLFTGDFSYNIPLIDVGGYPISLGYNSGITMDQEASWVGLGWNVNPGSIVRNMRGLPDDFNGTDSITKEISVKQNKTIGVSTGADVELAGLPITIGATLGVLHNTYRGWGLESGVNASISAGSKTAGILTAGLALNNSSQEGLTLTPSLSGKMSALASGENGGFGGSLGASLSYNTRSGLKALQFSGGLNVFRTFNKGTTSQRMATVASGSLGNGGAISFAYPAFTPTITMPYTSSVATVTLKLGGIVDIIHPSLFISGYISKQWIADEDKRQSLPGYGYLNYQNGAANHAALLDFNREKENIYREKPTLPNIAVPSYTYDVFNISGEGIGGNFRAYRSDIGYVFDHRMKTKDGSINFSGDMGFGDIIHGGSDFNYTRAFTESGPWIASNPLAAKVGFTKSSGTYEAVYFRNPAEKTVNSSYFYESLGGEDVVVPKLYQKGNNTQGITTTYILNKFRDGANIGEVDLSSVPTQRQEREKRTQVISYMTAAEAAVSGVNPYIENYGVNMFTASDCRTNSPAAATNDSVGIRGDYYQPNWRLWLYSRVDTNIYFPTKHNFKTWVPNGPNIDVNSFNVRWTGRVKPNTTGTYNVWLNYDDGIRFWVNDSLFVNDFSSHGNGISNVKLNLEAGQMYNFKLEYYNGAGEAKLYWKWTSATDTLQDGNFFLPATPPADSFAVDSPRLFKERRVNSIRKPNHISEISVLNPEGKRYIYGIPVYNIRQKEVTFSSRNYKDSVSGIVPYTSTDASVNNMQGTDRYYTSEEVPSYAHTFLLTQILSSDYVDMTGNGVSDDDLGNAVKFNYTKTAGKGNPYTWRTPYDKGANYNAGLKSDTRDDKASYVYGEKELWYLNAIESKNFIATFTIGKRKDLQSIDENGNKNTAGNPVMRLEEINLYTKADFIKKNTKARPVKTVHFEYSYELCKNYNVGMPDSASGKLTLKKVWFTYNGNKKGYKNAYVFNYNKKNPTYDHKSFDRWGNYKDPAQNPNATASNKITNMEYPYAIQDSTVAGQNVAAWTLDSILLPSGGRVKVTYESDDYGYVQNKRAAQMFSIIGFSQKEPVAAGDFDENMYVNAGVDDKLYVGVSVPEAVTSNQDLYNKYFYGLDTMLYMRLNVKMPDDKWGSGYEYVPVYAKLVRNNYGFLPGGKTIWFKVHSMDKSGNQDGTFSPMAKTSAQFLRLNLPSKAYPGSDVGDNLDLADGVRVLSGMADNIKSAVTSYDKTVRQKGWVKKVDLTRSHVRLASPGYKKYGNGLRVKRLAIYDNWNAMTGNREAMYGSEYEYTTIKNINGKDKMISSGVATYEPIIGAEENPLRVPIEYSDQSSAWAPVTMGYVETPITESFYPAPSVGYSVVRKRSINHKNVRSANGFEESHFYTAYDFPTITEYSLLNNDTKRKYKPALANFLRVNAKHHLVMSQGFKVELNDMHGQEKAYYSYSETDEIGKPSSYTVNYFHVDDQNAEIKHLKNNVLVMEPTWGSVYETTVGEDIELMMDMRQQQFMSNNVSVSVNGEAFTFSIPPIFGFGMQLILPQREENLFRSVAAMKVVNRHGILDSVVVVDKGSKIVTHNLLLDSESGEVLLSATQNEFGDSVFNFKYPAAWMYDGMSGAYKNLGATLEHVTITSGRIENFYYDQYKDYFTAGDEILTFARNSVDSDACSANGLATFANTGKVWAVDVNALKEGTIPQLFFVNKDGSPYSGNDVTMKVIRSGRRNISASAGSVTMMKNPLEFYQDEWGGYYMFNIDQSKKIIKANVTEYQENWPVEDKMKQKIMCAY